MILSRMIKRYLVVVRHHVECKSGALGQPAVAKRRHNLGSKGLRVEGFKAGVGSLSDHLNAQNQKVNVIHWKEHHAYREVAI